MNIVKDLISGGLSGIADAAGNLIAKFKADPTKVLEIEAEMQKLKIHAAQESERIAVQMEQEMTKRIESENKAISDRWTADMTSDSWLSKNARPIVLLSLVGFLFTMIISDSIEGWSFNVKDGYVSLMEALLITVIVAYFGGRSAEKFIRKK